MSNADNSPAPAGKTHAHAIPIWWFIGVLLLCYGVIITGAGIYHLFVPLDRPVVLAEIQAGLWWGIGLFTLGLFYTVRFFPRKTRTEPSGRPD
jgi:hypothetical protein